MINHDYTDWRLPTIDELNSIVDRTKYNPAIDTTYFPNTKAVLYLSATSFAEDDARIWFIDFTEGRVDYSYAGFGWYVRLVRDVSPKSKDLNKHFVDNQDGTVTDNRTDLMWMQDARGPYTVDGVHKLIKKLNEEKA